MEVCSRVLFSESLHHTETNQWQNQFADFYMIIKILQKRFYKTGFTKQLFLKFSRKLRENTCSYGIILQSCKLETWNFVKKETPAQTFSQQFYKRLFFIGQLLLNSSSSFQKEQKIPTAAMTIEFKDFSTLTFITSWCICYNHYVSLINRIRSFK